MAEIFLSKVEKCCNASYKRSFARYNFKLVLFYFTIFVSFKASSQKFEIINNDTVNRVDKKGFKQGKWIEFIGENGRSEYYFLNGKKNGIYRYYDAENKISEQGFIKNDKEEGETKEFRNGRIWRSRKYHKNELVTQIIYYYENGNPKIGGSFFRGNGIKYEYDSLGFTISKRTYKNHKLNGQFEEYFKNKQLKERGIYKNNKYWTISERYDSLGTKLDFGNIKSGNGYVYCQDDSARVFKSEEYKFGKLWNVLKFSIQPYEYESVGTFVNGNGILREYNSKGKLVSELSYKNGLLNGFSKYYYGDVILMGGCLNDKRVGKWMRYNRGIIQNILDYNDNEEYSLTCF